MDRIFCNISTSRQNAHYQTLLSINLNSLTSYFLSALVLNKKKNSYVNVTPMFDMSSSSERYKAKNCLTYTMSQKVSKSNKTSIISVMNTG